MFSQVLGGSDKDDSCLIALPLVFMPQSCRLQGRYRISLRIAAIDFLGIGFNGIDEANNFYRGYLKYAQGTDL